MSSKNKKEHLGAETTVEEVAVALDSHGNPAGTLYLHDGTATHEDYEQDELKHLAAPPPESGLEYDHDGTFFKLPEDYGKVLQALNEEIAGYKKAITATETAMEGAKNLIAMQPEDMQHSFDGIFASQQLKIDSDREYMEAAISRKAKYALSLEKPSVRNAKRELAEVQAEIKALKIREAELIVICGATGAVMVKNGEPSTNKVTHTRAAGTDEQKANLAAGLSAHDNNQGQMIIAAVRLGWKNNKIANFYGIPDANVPGPKNRFLRSTEGEKWKAENPGLLESIGLESTKEKKA